MLEEVAEAWRAAGLDVGMAVRFFARSISVLAERVLAWDVH